MCPTALFSSGNLDKFLASRDQTMQEEIDALGSDRLIGTEPPGIADYCAEKYRLVAPELREGGMTQEQEEVEIDVSQDTNRAIFNRGKPFLIKGTRFTVFVPFDGNVALFRFCPNRFYDSRPHADLIGNELILTYDRTNPNPEELGGRIKADLAVIKEWLTWVEAMVRQYNERLRDGALAYVTARRTKLLSDKAAGSALGIPPRRRTGAPTTYAVPAVRRKMPSPPPPSKAAALPAPEPRFEMEDYEHVLRVMANMVQVIERSPGTFRGMHEEDIRNHFLVQLNAQYEGQATAETFNGEGKTDILLRIGGRNAFIGECKFWDGPKSLSDAINQVLSYASWRDTKAAILLFNRNKNFSAVLAQVPGIVKIHPNHRRPLPYESETGWRFVFHHRDDPMRELFLTVLAFEVPEAP